MWTYAYGQYFLEWKRYSLQNVRSLQQHEAKVTFDITSIRKCRIIFDEKVLGVVWTGIQTTGLY